MAELHMKMSKKAERVAKFGNNMRPNLRRGIQRAATMLQGHIKQLLSGQSHTRVPGNPNPYPGVLSNRLRSSVTVDMGRDGRSAKVGPNMVYGPALEFGHPRWKSGVRYPFMGPAQKQKGGDVIKIIDDELLKGF